MPNVTAEINAVQTVVEALMVVQATRRGAVLRAVATLLDTYIDQ